MALAIGLHYHVVDVDVDIAANLARKALLHAPLVGCPGVLEAEGHGGVAEGSEWRDERRLFLVLNNHFDLVVPRVGVKETQRLRARGGVDYFVDSREDELLLWAGAVQVCVVGTHSPGPVLLLDQDWVCQPLGVFDWPDEGCSE